MENKMNGICFSRARSVWLLAAGTVVTGVLASLAGLAQQPAPAAAQKADSVLILKKDHVLELLSGGKVIGVLHVGALTGRPFGHRDAELLQMAADRAALALYSMMAQDDALAASRCGAACSRPRCPPCRALTWQRAT